MLDLLFILDGFYIGQRSERRKRGIWLVETFALNTPLLFTEIPAGVSRYIPA